jgi:hypothetical protein
MKGVVFVPLRTSAEIVSFPSVSWNPYFVLFLKAAVHRRDGTNFTD